MDGSACPRRHNCFLSLEREKGTLGDNVVKIGVPDSIPSTPPISGREHRGLDKVFICVLS